MSHQPRVLLAEESNQKTECRSDQSGIASAVGTLQCQCDSGVFSGSLAHGDMIDQVPMLWPRMRPCDSVIVCVSNSGGSVQEATSRKSTPRQRLDGDGLPLQASPSRHHRRHPSPAFARFAVDGKDTHHLLGEGSAGIVWDRLDVPFTSFELPTSGRRQ